VRKIFIIERIKQIHLRHFYPNSPGSFVEQLRTDYSWCPVSFFNWLTLIDTIFITNFCFVVNTSCTGGKSKRELIRIQCAYAFSKQTVVCQRLPRTSKSVINFKCNFLCNLLLVLACKALKEESFFCWSFAMHLINTLHIVY